MTTYYLGTTKSGAIVSRKSTRSDFTHAACRVGYKTGDKHPLPSFSTSVEGAVRNFAPYNPGEPEIVPVRKVDARTFRLATKA